MTNGVGRHKAKAMAAKQKKEEDLLWCLLPDCDIQQESNINCTQVPAPSSLRLSPSSQVLEFNQQPEMSMKIHGVIENR